MNLRVLRPLEAVPRYFFHVRDGKSVPDNDGLVLPDANPPAIKRSSRPAKP